MKQIQFGKLYQLTSEEFLFENEEEYNLFIRTTRGVNGRIIDRCEPGQVFIPFEVVYWGKRGHIFYKVLVDNKISHFMGYVPIYCSIQV